MLICFKSFYFGMLMRMTMVLTTPMPTPKTTHVHPVQTSSQQQQQVSTSKQTSKAQWWLRGQAKQRCTVPTMRDQMPLRILIHMKPGRTKTCITAVVLPVRPSTVWWTQHTLSLVVRQCR